MRNLIVVFSLMVCLAAGTFVEAGGKSSKEGKQRVVGGVFDRTGFYVETLFRGSPFAERILDDLSGGVELVGEHLTSSVVLGIFNEVMRRDNEGNRIYVEQMLNRIYVRDEGTWYLMLVHAGIQRHIDLLVYMINSREGDERESYLKKSIDSLAENREFRVIIALNKEMTISEEVFIAALKKCIIVLIKKKQILGDGVVRNNVQELFDQITIEQGYRLLRELDSIEDLTDSESVLLVSIRNEIEARLQFSQIQEADTGLHTDILRLIVGYMIHSGVNVARGDTVKRL